MPQCSRTRSDRRFASASSGLRLVIAYSTSTVVLPCTVRSRVISIPCASPGHFWRRVRIEVERTVRFSTRPCPFSTCECSRSGDTGGGSGGKSRRNLAGACLEAEPRSYVSLQPKLIAFDREQVVPSLFDDLRTQVTLAKHRVTEDDAPLDRQDAEQFESRLVFVGLGIDAYLREDCLMLMGESGYQMLARRLAITAATEVLAVEGDRILGGARRRRWQPRRNPTRESCLKSDGVQNPEEIGKTRGRRRLATTKSQRVRQGDAMIATELGNGRGPFAAVEHGQHRERQHREEWMPSAMTTAWIRHVRKRFQQGKRSHPGNLQNQKIWLPLLLDPPAHAKLNRRIALPQELHHASLLLFVCGLLCYRLCR